MGTIYQDAAAAGEKHKSERERSLRSPVTDALYANFPGNPAKTVSLSRPRLNPFSRDKDLILSFFYTFSLSLIRLDNGLC